MKINVKFSNAAEWEAFINLLSAQGYKTWKGCTWAAHKRRTVNGRVKYTRFTDFPVISVRVDTKKIGFARAGEYTNAKSLGSLTSSQMSKIFNRGPAPIVIHGEEVTFLRGRISVGCYDNIPNETVRQVCGRLK